MRLHLLGDVVAEAPEVDDVTAAAEARRLLDEQHFVIRFQQPIGERRTRDAGAVDCDFHIGLLAQRGQNGLRPALSMRHRFHWPASRHVVQLYFSLLDISMMGCSLLVLNSLTLVPFLSKSVKCTTRSVWSS